MRSAALTISVPPDVLAMTDTFMVEGQTLTPNQSAPLGPLIFVNATSFSTIGAPLAPLVRGRFFTERDDENASAAVISTTRSRLVLSRRRSGRPPADDWRTGATDQYLDDVVGVVDDMSCFDLAAPSCTCRSVNNEQLPVT